MIRLLHCAAACVALDAAAAQPADTGRVRTAPGVSIYFERYGSGRQLVLVPNRLHMPDFRSLARPHRTLVLYDMRNRGRSGRVEDTAQITIAGDVHDIDALRRHFGFEQASVIGYSYLGLMVALYATQYPRHVDRIVQIGPVPRQYGTSYPSDQTSDLGTLDAEGAAAAEAWRAARAEASSSSDPVALCRVQRRFLSFLLVGNPANHRQVPDVCLYENEHYHNQVRHLSAHFGDIQRSAFPKEPFTALEQPVLTIHGTLDRNAPYGGGLEWATTFRNGRLITVDGGAHQVWLDDRAVLSDIDEFLSGSWPARAQRFGRH